MSSKTKHVLITGGSRGIGLSIAQLFATNAYRCTLLSRSEANLEAALKTLAPSADAPSRTDTHSFIAGDISSAEFWSTAHIGASLKARGMARVDVFVNCAGITQSKLFTATAPESIQGIIDTNLTSMMLGTRFLLRSRLLGSARRGKVSGVEEEARETTEFSPVVINVASLLGLQGGYGAVAYAASKAGVLGFTRALAGEYVSHGVRVNAVVPGYVDTDMTRGWFASHTSRIEEKMRELTCLGLNTAALQDRIPLKRFGRPEEIAHAALFLAQNQYAHNCVINVDGGLSAV
jgi:NAD(P)-dependent dehydrogenase (short-subunit alcohol dehydrogenase family)